MAQTRNPNREGSPPLESVSQGTVYPRFDGWASATSSLGSIRDKSTSTYFARRALLDEAQINALYVQDSTAAKIVDLIVDDALREGFDLGRVQDAQGRDLEIDQNAVMAKLEDLGGLKALERAAKWSRKDGGALVMIPCFDGRAPHEPAELSPSSVWGRFGVVPARYAQPNEQDTGLFSPTYGRTLSWLVSGDHQTTVEVHHSRVIPLEAMDLPMEQARVWSPFGWAPSVLERVVDALARDGAGAQHAVNMLYTSSILYLKLQRLKTEHDRKGGPEKIRALLADIQKNLDAIGLLGIDADDDIGVVTRTMAGVSDMLDRSRDRVAAASETPREILFNESPSGLRGGEMSGAQKIWFQRVRQYQRKDLTPALDRMLEVAFASMGIPAARWSIDWRPLWAPDDSVESETYAKRAEADRAYLDMGAITADEIRRERFEQGKASGGLALEATGVDVETEETAAVETPEDEAMNGAQIASLIEIMRVLNAGEMTYTQAVGVLTTAFPRLANRAESILGPEPETADDGDGVGASTLPQPDDVVDVRQAAARFGIPTRTLTLALDRGELPYWGFGKRRVVSLKAVEEFGKHHEAPAASEAPAAPEASDETDT